MHGDILRVHVVLCDGTKIFVVFVVKPKDCSAFAGHAMCSCAGSGGNSEPWGWIESRVFRHVSGYSLRAAGSATLHERSGTSRHSFVTSSRSTGPLATGRNTLRKLADDEVTRSRYVICIASCRERFREATAYS